MDDEHGSSHPTQVVHIPEHVAGAKRYAKVSGGNGCDPDMVGTFW